jgi:prolyl-tRNA synthetase
VPAPLVAAGHPAMQVLDTPNTPTIQTLVDHLNHLELGRQFSGADTLKNLVLKTQAPGRLEWELLVIGVPGDRDVDLKRVQGQLEPVQVAQAEPADLAAQPRLVKGYIGPQILKELGIRYLVDPLVVPGSAWVTGANAPNQHAAAVVRGRDFEPDGEIGAVEIRDGDLCARCGGRLSIARGIEIGHIFQLGRKFANAFGLDALGPDAKPIRITMGSYGIGVSRAVAALAEQHHDELGLVWPASVAPADVHLVAAGKEDQLAAAETLATAFDTAGVRVLFDDRTGVSVGVKFKDAELIGVPLIVVVGRGLVDGLVEVRDRETGERGDVAIDAVVANVTARLTVS